MRKQAFSRTIIHLNEPKQVHKQLCSGCQFTKQLKINPMTNLKNWIAGLMVVLALGMTFQASAQGQNTQQGQNSTNQLNFLEQYIVDHPNLVGQYIDQSAQYKGNEVIQANSCTVLLSVALFVAAYSTPTYSAVGGAYYNADWQKLRDLNQINHSRAQAMLSQLP